jgi:hypothetical protein
VYSTPVDLSFSYLRSAVEASLDIKKDQVDPNKNDNIYTIKMITSPTLENDNIQAFKNDNIYSMKNDNILYT